MTTDLSREFAPVIHPLFWWADVDTEGLSDDGGLAVARTWEYDAARKIPRAVYTFQPGALGVDVCALVEGLDGLGARVRVADDLEWAGLLSECLEASIS